MRTGLIALLAGLALAPAAQAAPDRSITLTADAPTATWTSADGTGINPWNQADQAPNAPVGHACTKSPHQYCDTALVRVQLQDLSGTVSFRIEGFQNRSDFDLRVYEADDQGNATSEYITPSGDGNGLVPLETFFGDWETSTATVAPDDTGAALASRSAITSSRRRASR